jgi:hypothetical protein
VPTFHFVELVLSLDYFSSLDSAAYAASSDGDADNDLSSLPGGFDKSFLSKPVWGTEHEQKVQKTPLLNSVIPFFARQAVEKQMIDAFNRRGLATLTT